MWAVVATLSLVAGGAASYYRQHQQPEASVETEAKPVVLSTDAFSLRLFHHALSSKASGNILVAPRTLGRALIALQDIAGGKTLEELQALQLSTESHLRNSEPDSAALLGKDFSLPKGEKAAQVMTLPFSENVPMALGLFNGMLAPVMGNPDAQLADSNMVTSRTRLLAGCVARFQADWNIPFHSADTRTADFDSASGGMPHFSQMRSRGLYQVAEAADGSWKAVALPMKGTNISRIPLVYIGILPGGSAREFATALTPEKLTEIRRALSTAEPQDTLVELPRLELQVPPYDSRDNLRRLGLKALFDSETADFSGLTPEKIHLGAMVQSLEVLLTESKTQSAPNPELDYAAKCISFNRPFIWLIADLETPTPIEFMGLVEEM